MRKGGCTIQQIDDLFPSYKTAQRRVKTLAKRKRVRLVGFYHGRTGRPKDVYCCWQPKMDMIEHEVRLTEFLLSFEIEILRGSGVDERLRPDATILTDPVMHVEMDCGTMDYKRLRMRLSRYEEIVLVLTTTEHRRDALLEACRMDHILAAVFEETIDEPTGRVWKNYEGKYVAIAGE